MSLKQSHTLIIGTAVLTLLSACSRTSENSQSSQPADSSQSAASSQSTQMPKTAADPGPSHSAGDLDCPVAPAQRAGSTLDLTPGQIDSVGRQLGAGGIKETAAAVDRLRLRNPNATEGEIVNYLITAYCPTIKAKSGMSLGEQQQAIRSFATQARKLVRPA
jgi:hypothetical protein